MTSLPKIQLLVFEGCPLAAAARESLRSAVASAGLEGFEEVDLLDEATTDDLKCWGSPTILIDGRDLTGAGKGEGIGCRVYEGPEKVPSPEEIMTAIRRFMG